MPLDGESRAELDFIHLRTGEEKRKAATLKMADPALRYAAL
jgi:hypothetical protein